MYGVREMGNDLIRHGFAVPPSPEGKAFGYREAEAGTPFMASDQRETTSSVTASPCHLPLKGKACGRHEWRPYGEALS